MLHKTTHLQIYAFLLIRQNKISNNFQALSHPQKSTIHFQSFTETALAYVQYLYSICTVYVRFRSVHILYIYCTNTVHMPGNV